MGNYRVGVKITFIKSFNIPKVFPNKADKRISPDIIQAFPSSFRERNSKDKDVWMKKKL
jgi:hypothetical protein